MSKNTQSASGYWENEADKMWAEFENADATGKWVVYGRMQQVEKQAMYTLDMALGHASVNIIPRIKEAMQNVAGINNKMRIALNLPLVQPPYMSTIEWKIEQEQIVK